ncbi:MAG: T9SS type A sorting domain-containing protein [Ignavibacteria bacterium]|nr:T9SS type A sorting domain-containing protein [Ignavibacteria bacterium]
MKRLAILLFFLALAVSPGSAQPASVAGFRASRVLGSYPNRQFPSADYWINVGKEMASRFPGSTPGGVWIVSLYQSNGVSQFNFPGNGIAIPYIQFIGSDQNEAYLTRFDSAGFNIWLQVESGAASMDTLIPIVLNRYKHHSCVRGFGVDVEWFFANTNSGGRKVTDAEAQSWEQRVKAVDPSYTLFLKHYAASWMPPTFRGNILFVDDSQQFTSLTQMVNEFKAWGSKFSPNPVAFQFGYKIDTTWWKQYADPALTIGTALRSAIVNTSGLFWVDFTVSAVFPPTGVESGPVTVPRLPLLSQNYPNPFNPSTAINYQLRAPSGVEGSAQSFVTLKVFDLLGREVSVLVNEMKEAGMHTVTWNAGEVPTGVYLYKLTAGDLVATRRMILLR